MSLVHHAAQTLTPFSQLAAAMQAQGGDYTISLPADWLQGRTAYGGLSASLCLEATFRHLPDLPPLRSAQICFVGPASGQLHISVNVLRRGKSTVVIGADLHGESGLAVRSTFCFGAARVSAQNYLSLPMPSVAAPAECPNYYVWPNRPNFMAHFDGRLAAGAVPLTPAAKPEMTVWLRHRDPGDDSSLVRLFALADALPPAALVLANERALVSTMTWSLDMLDIAPSSPTGWWLVQTAAESSCEGYSAQGTVIWNAEGQAVAVARQNATIFG
jgi:acyl-CoA thioesterase